MKPFLFALLLVAGCGQSPSRYQFFTGQGQTGGVVLWKCDSQTGDTWWTTPAPDQFWHKVPQLKFTAADFTSNAVPDWAR